MNIKFFLVVAIILISGCSNLPSENLSKNLSSSSEDIKLPPPLPPMLSSSFFGKPQKVIDVNEVYSLTKNQKQDFLS